MSVSGTVKSPGGDELVVDHFHVEGIGGNFAIEGDSGGIVGENNELIGIVRAADTKRNIAVVTRLDNVWRKALEFDV